MAHNAHNPWQDLHMQGEMDFTGDGYSRAQAAALVRGEYASAPAPETCGCCGAQAFYRATVGAMQCPSCRAIQFGVWVHKETGEERRSMDASISSQYRLEYRWS